MGALRDIDALLDLLPPSGSSSIASDVDDEMKVGIIGCGASGLAAIKIIQESKPFQEDKWSLQAFEAREDVGGTWYVSELSFTLIC